VNTKEIKQIDTLKTSISRYRIGEGKNRIHIFFIHIRAGQINIVLLLFETRIRQFYIFRGPRAWAAWGGFMYDEKSRRLNYNNNNK